MKVYIVIQEEYHCGSDVDSVWLSEEKAQKRVQEIKPTLRPEFEGVWINEQETKE